MQPHRFPRFVVRLGLALALPFGLLAASAPSQAAVMISQVYGGGGNGGATFANDFVELHNSGALPVSVAGWTVQYASTAGTTWNATAVLAGSIPAGGYYLVRLASSGAVGAAVPTPDASGGAWR